MFDFFNYDKPGKGIEKRNPNKTEYHFILSYYLENFSLYVK